MKKFVFRILILLGVVFIVCNILSFMSLSFLRKSNFYKPSFMVNQLIDKKLDYIVLGSSVGLTGLNTATIDQESGLQGLNLSMDDTAMSSHYLMLQHFLAEGKSIDYCILAPTVNNFDKDRNSIGNNDYRFMMFINRSYIQSYYNNFRELEADLMGNSFYIPMLGVSYYNSEIFYPSLLTAINPSKRNRFDSEGNYTYPATSIINDTIKERSGLTISFENPWLQKIAQLCKEHQIELINYIAPMKNISVNPVSSNTSVINFSEVLNNSRFFYDDIHINSIGRELVSKDMAKILKSKNSTKN